MLKTLLPALLIGLSISAFAQVDALMPVPKELTVNDGRFLLNGEFNIQLGTKGVDRLQPAVERFMQRLGERTGMAFITKVNESTKPALTVQVESSADLALGVDESYTLTVDWKGALIQAKTDIGALRGLQTLQQLLSADQEGFHWPYLVINDSPRFPWRGLLIDVCRHWQPMDVILRNLDAMATVKMNVLHLHLTEDQGFRVESKVYPKLHEQGSNGKYFTQENIKEIVAYAGARGIRVIPEFDMPGHASSWFVGHPELASGNGPYSIETRFGVMDPTIDPTKDETYEFLDAFLGEMATLFPDAYMHIGGDENNGKEWAANEDIQKFMKKNKLADAHALQAYFNGRISEILTKHGKRMVGWDEVQQPGLPNTVVIQSWRGQEGLLSAAREGYDCILSNGYYIDLCQSAAFHYQNDPLPIGSEFTDEQKKRVPGGEATMWAEMVTRETIDSRIWPRTAAIAERFWSPASVNDVADMYRRLPIVSQRLEEAGAMHVVNRELMMRRAANGGDITKVKQVLDLVAPLEGYARHNQGKAYNTSFPFNRAPDMAIPDPANAREIGTLVQEYVAGSESAGTELSILFRSMLSCELIRRQYNDAPALRELDPLVENVMTVANVGLRTIKDIDAQDGPSSEQSLSYSRKELEAAKAPKVECTIPWVVAIEQLLDYAAKQ